MVINGNLTVNALNATVDNHATVSGTITIQDVSSDTWNEYASGNNLDFQAEGKTLNIGNDAQVGSLTINASNSKVKVSSSASIDTVTFNENATIIIENSVNAELGDGVEVTVKSNEEDEGIVIEGSEETKSVDLALEAAKKAVENAENAKSNFESKYNNSSLDWDTLITAMYYLDEQAKVKVNALADSYSERDSLNNRIGALKDYYQSLTQLDMSNENNSKYEISTGALINFKGLTNLNLSNTGITELGGLIGMSNLEKLDISKNEIPTTSGNDQLGALAGLISLKELDLSNTDVTAISAIAGLENLEELNISGTKLTNLNVFWNGTSANFPNLKILQANNIDTLESIAGLVEIVNKDVFSSEGITWDLSGSTLANDDHGHIQMIKNKFFNGTFKEPTVEDTISPIATLTGFNSNSMTLAFNEPVKMGESNLKNIDTTNKVNFIKSLFVENERYNLLDVSMDEDNIEITTTDRSITITLSNNALKKDIMHYLDDPDYTPEGFTKLTTGDKNGKYRMDAEIDLSKFTDLAGNQITGTISNPFKIEYTVTVNEGSPDYNSDVVATFLTE